MNRLFKTVLSAVLSGLLIGGANAATISDGVWYPENAIFGAVPGTVTLATLDAYGEKAGCVFRASQTGTIKKVGFRTATVTTATSLDVTLQTVSATTGFPDGSSSLYGGSSSGTVTTGSVTSNTGITVTLTTGAAVTAGDVVGFVVEFSTGAGNLGISGGVTSAGYKFPGSAYQVSNTGSWAKSAGSCNIWLEYDDGAYYYNDGLQHPFGTGTLSTTFNSGSSPNERGIKFSLPENATVSAANVIATFTGPATLTLYDSDGTTSLQTMTIDTDTVNASASTSFMWTFSTPVNLSANTYYRIGVKPTTTTNVTIAGMNVASAAVLSQVSGGQNFHMTTRTGAGAWSDTTTSKYYISLRLTGIGSGGASAYGFAN